jgi:2-polyprenyl-3-methyl-5-hydroxy-6-metoxy-1,4-benzoquinol methylase
MVQIGYTIPKEAMFLNHSYLSGTTRSLRQHFSEVCHDILGRVSILPRDYILDIGGNDGTFLSILAEQGINVLNVESSAEQARLSETNGVHSINNFFDNNVAEEILANKGLAKVIHGSGIFFHLEDLHSVFSGVKLLLDAEGVVVAEFIYLPEMVRSCAYDQIYHEHLLYYTLRSFDSLLQQHGLTIFDAELKPIHGGSCVAYITHIGSAEKTMRLKELEAAESDRGDNEIQVYRDFALRAGEMRIKLRDMLCNLRSDGNRVQAIGAPVKGTTILNFCGLTEDVVECAIEVNPMKFYTYYPGTKIPVYPQDEVEEPDIYLLLAWNFKREILDKLEEFRSKGGKILVPIPEPRLF